MAAHNLGKIKLVKSYIAWHNKDLSTGIRSFSTSVKLFYLDNFPYYGPDRYIYDLA